MPLINKPGLLFTMITGGHSALEEGIFCQFSVIFFLQKHNKTERSACYMLKLSTYANAAIKEKHLCHRVLGRY